MIRLSWALLFVLASPVVAQQAATPDWRQIEAETLQHFQALLRFDTSDPPGTEREAAEYLKQALETEGIAVEMFALESELHRFVRFQWDIVNQLAAARRLP